MGEWRGCGALFRREVHQPVGVNLRHGLHVSFILGEKSKGGGGESGQPYTTTAIQATTTTLYINKWKKRNCTI